MSDIHPNVAASGIDPSDRDTGVNFTTPSVTSEIRTTLDLLFQPGETICVSAIRSNGTMAKKFVGSVDKAERLLTRADASGSWKGFYVNLQCLKDGATTDTRGDVEKYVHFMVDIDRKNKKLNGVGVNASEEELAALANAKDEVVRFLTLKLGASPLVAFSGNGYHIVYSLRSEKHSVSASPESMATVKNCLLLVKAKFESALVEIDSTVAEPEQLTRAYGTWNRRYADQPGRPQRKSELISVPEPWVSISFSKLEALAAELPVTARTTRKSQVEFPKTVGDFDIHDYMGFNNLESDEDEFVRNGVHYIPLTECPMAERRHRGKKDEVTCLTYTGDGGFGFSCMNEAECGEYTIKDVIRKLARKNGRYPEPIFEEKPLDEVEFDCAVPDQATDKPESKFLSGDELARLLGAEEIAENEHEQQTESEQPCSEAQCADPVRTGWSDLDWTQKLACVIFRDPRACFNDYAIWRQRLLKIIQSKAWPKTTMPLLKAITGFELSSRRLPTKAELLHKHENDLDVIQLVQYLEPVEDIPLDYVAENIVRTAAYLDEKRTAEKYLKTVTEAKDVAKARTWVKTRWQDSITMLERRVHEGSIQDNAEAVYERFRRMQEGQTAEEAAKSLRFSTGFPSIDSAINSDLERCFAIAGPPNNFKTSVLLSVVNNLGRQGKAVLLVTGEHDANVLEEYMALLQGYHMRDQLPVPLPAYKLWRDKKATKEHLDALRLVIDDMKALRSIPGPVVVKHINDFHNDLDEVLQYMENTHAKYEWKALVIDPFDALLLNTDAQQRFFKGAELIQRLFDLKTSYHGGDGLIVMTSLQMKKRVKGEVEKLQHKRDSGLNDFRDVLDASEIELHSAAVQKFDMLWGVASRNDAMTQGVLVCSRVRFGHPFESFWFRVDPSSHYCYEPRLVAPVVQVQMDEVNPEEIV